VIDTATGSSTARFGYDNDNLPTCASQITCTPPGTDSLRYTYNSAGLPTAVAIGSLTESLTYNAYGELATYTVKHGGTTLFSTTYHSTSAPRDNLGRIQVKTENVSGITHSFEYGYDDRGRLITVAEDGVLASEYQYDANGNRELLDEGGGVTLGSYDDQDRILAYGNYTFEHDANGALLAKIDPSTNQVADYYYDVLGNLLGVDLSTGESIDYVIDGKNRRVGKKVNGTLVQAFLYKDQLRIAAELDASGDIVSRFVYAGNGGSPDYMVRGGVVYRFVKDQLGSPRLIVDSATGLIAQEIEYDAFGRVVLDSNPGFQPFGFAGGLYDGDTGLVRFGARDYDAVTGRWTAKDRPGTLALQGNLYSYAFNDPVNLVDKQGLFPSYPTPECLDAIANGCEVGCVNTCGGYLDEACFQLCYNLARSTEIYFPGTFCPHDQEGTSKKHSRCFRESEGVFQRCSESGGLWGDCESAQTAYFAACMASPSGYAN
jgi:RHS repeat-associated protein